MTIVFQIRVSGEPDRHLELERPTVRIGAAAHSDITVPVAADSDTLLISSDDGSRLLVRPRVPGAVELVRPGLPAVPVTEEAEVPCGSVLRFVGDEGADVEIRILTLCAPPCDETRSLGPVGAVPPSSADAAWVQLATALSETDEMERVPRMLARFLSARALPVDAVAIAVPGPSESDDDSLWRLIGERAGSLIPPRLLTPGVAGREALRSGHALTFACADGSAVLFPLIDEGRLHAIVACAAAAGDDELARLLGAVGEVIALLTAAAARCRRHEELLVADEENRYFRTRRRRHDIFKDFVAESPSMRQLHREMSGFVANGRPVLLRGEAGTGKELLARAMHHLGSRRDGLYIAVHCGAGDEQELEIELFGLARTEADGRRMQRRGVLELASSGTVFLDEIHLLSAPLQARLMRAIAEGEIFRVGESQARRTGARLVGATHHDLLDLADEGRFRRDLAVLLGQQTLIVPPLRRRREDFDGLSTSFLRQHARRYRKAVQRIDADCLRWLSGLTWPGNVRELQTVIERAVLQAAPEQTVLVRSDFELR